MQGSIVVYASNQGDFVRDSRHSRQMFTDMQSRNHRRNRSEFTTHFRGRIRFQIVRIDMTGAAVIEDQDASANGLRRDRQD